MGMLNGQQYREFCEALINAYPAQANLEQMYRFRFGQNLNAIAMGDDLTTIVFRLIQAAEAGGWTAKLIVAARESQPGNERLLLFAQAFALAPKTPQRHLLERLLVESNSFLDVERWRMQLGQLEGKVCRIEVGPCVGTGFLVGPSLVLTNHHVMELLLAKEVEAKDVVLRFDYRRLADGLAVHAGTKVRLAENWLVASSPPSPLDLDSSDTAPVIPDDQLDFVLLRIEGSPGSAPIGANPNPDAPARGWIEFPPSPSVFDTGTPLFILQHPEGAPLQLALDTQAILGVNANATRVRYRTNTLPGSSGSPCFDINWQLVALHQSGDPSYTKAAYNQGIPISAIAAVLAKQDKSGLLGKQKA